MNPKIQKPTVTKYVDYRDYIKDHIEFAKSQRASFSFQYCATKLGTSKSYLKLVSEKKRHISLDKVSLVGRLFKLNGFEPQFFVIMFLKCTSKDPSLSEYFEIVLGRLKHRLKYSHTHEGNPSPESQEIVFSSWIHMVIHSLARLGGFKPEVSWVREQLRSHPKVADEEISAALKEIVSNGSIKQAPEGHWYPDQFVFRSPDIFDHDRFKIYKIGHQLANSVLDDVNQNLPSHFHMMSISLDEGARERAFEIFTEARDKLIALSKACEKPERVFFIANSIFPLSK